MSDTAIQLQFFSDFFYKRVFQQVEYPNLFFVRTMTSSFIYHLPYPRHHFL